MKHEAHDYDARARHPSMRRQGRRVECSDCGTADVATPRRRRCRFCGSPHLHVPAPTRKDTP